ncbi:MAG: MATE family efflux transporter, partial [Lachnospiraceae bacterium]|nr:MATE family efflux transporter [Lachnospiraceae bacterium]
EANSYLKAIVKITIILSLVLGALLSAAAWPIMELCNRQPDTVHYSVSFFRIIIGLMVFHNISVVLNGALRGIGENRITLVSSLAMGVVDIVFNYLLIEGRFGFPRLGVAGNAIATVLGTVVACLISYLAIVKKTDFLDLKGVFSYSLRKDKERTDVIRIKAGDIVLENLFIRIGFLVSSIISSYLASSQTAVYSVGMILFNYSFAFADGLGKATLTLAGKSAGAGNTQEIRYYRKTIHRIGWACSAILSLLFVLGSRFFFGLFFDDPTALREGFYTSLIVSTLVFLQIIRIIDISVLRSIGQSGIPKKIAILCVLFVNPISSFLFTMVFPLNIWGIWLASFITQAVWFFAGTTQCRRHLKAMTSKMENTLC